MGRCKVQVEGFSGVLDDKVTAGVLRVNLSRYPSLDQESEEQAMPALIEKRLEQARTALQAVLMGDGLGQLDGKTKVLRHRRGPPGISLRSMSTVKRGVDFYRVQARRVTLQMSPLPGKMKHRNCSGPGRRAGYRGLLAKALNSPVTAPCRG